MDRGELQQACEKFAASQALESGLGTLLYLGDCYERAGRFASALSTFQTASALAGTRGDSAREHLASVRASALEPRVPTLQIRRGPAPQAVDLQITVNGSPIESAELGRPIARDSGIYEIRFSAPGYEAFVSHLQLKNGEGGSAVISVPRLVPLVAGGSEGFHERPRAADERGSSQRTAAWVLGGAGVALAATAGIFAGLAASKDRDSKENCDADDSNRCGPGGVRLRNDAQSLATAATVSSVVGGLGLVGGLVLYLSAPANAGPFGDAALLSVGGPLL